jgi:hypothetical protein
VLAIGLAVVKGGEVEEEVDLLVSLISGGGEEAGDEGLRVER